MYEIEFLPCQMPTSFTRIENDGGIWRIISVNCRHDSIPKDVSTSSEVLGELTQTNAVISWCTLKWRSEAEEVSLKPLGHSMCWLKTDEEYTYMRFTQATQVSDPILRTTDESVQFLRWFLWQSHWEAYLCLRTRHNEIDQDLVGSHPYLGWLEWGKWIAENKQKVRRAPLQWNKDGSRWRVPGPSRLNVTSLGATKFSMIYRKIFSSLWIMLDWTL